MLYRFVIPWDPDFIRMRTLAAIGAHITLHTTMVAQAQAFWMADTSQQGPDYGSIQRETFYHTECQRVRRPKGTGGIGDPCLDLVFDSLPYVNLLLSDLGIPCHKKSSWYREMTESYRLSDFEGLVQEWLLRGG